MNKYEGNILGENISIPQTINTKLLWTYYIQVNVLGALCIYYLQIWLLDNKILLIY